MRPRPINPIFSITQVLSSSSVIREGRPVQ
jgi:hypothetical protein